MIKTGIRRVGAMLLAAALAFGTARAEDADPVVVRVGDVKYTKSEIEASLQSDIDLSELLQMRYLTEEERANLVQGHRLYITFEGKVMHFFDPESEKNLLY